VKVDFIYYFSPTISRTLKVKKRKGDVAVPDERTETEGV
jgi:hypothetical protein